MKQQKLVDGWHHAVILGEDVYRVHIDVFNPFIYEELLEGQALTFDGVSYSIPVRVFKCNGCTYATRFSETPNPDNRRSCNYHGNKDDPIILSLGTALDGQDVVVRAMPCLADNVKIESMLERGELEKMHVSGLEGQRLVNLFPYQGNVPLGLEDVMVTAYKHDMPTVEVKTMRDHFFNAVKSVLITPVPYF